MEMVVCTLSAIAMGAAIPVLSSKLISPHVLGLGVIVLGVFVCLSIVFMKVRSQNRGNPRLASGLVLWIYLLATEAVFVRVNPLEDAYGGEFTFAAHAEGIAWALLLVFLLVLTLPTPEYLSLLLRGSWKYVTLFWLAVLTSITYSIRPMYSLAWAGKLSLVILLLCWCSGSMHDIKDVRTFLLASLWGFLICSVAPLVQFVGAHSEPFREGRLGGLFSPTVVSESSGIVLLLLLTLYSAGWRRSTALVGLIGLVTLILGGGKAATAAFILSVGAFYLLQKKVGLGMVLTAVVVIVVLAGWSVFGPLTEYVRAYVESGSVYTLTGRTRLWVAAMPAIMESPLWGHGYVTSKFSAIQMGPVFASHMHNAFLEVLYNNGLVGLTVVAGMSYVTIKNLLAGMRGRRNKDEELLCLGCFVLYMYLLVNGLFTVSFGGRPSSNFMLFLALLVVSARVRDLSELVAPWAKREGH
jgi:O-antigen ligase